MAMAITHADSLSGIFSSSPQLQTSSRFFMANATSLKPMNADLHSSAAKQLSRGRPAVTHSMPREKEEIFRQLEGWTEQNILPMLKPVERSWQPQDFLPDACSGDFFSRVEELRRRAAELPDHYFVCLVGDTITEEALPSYLNFLNSFDGVRDETGNCPSPWARWSRAWTAEENRHGDLLNKYLYLCGKVDMRQIEKTIQYLLSNGVDLGAENNPYLGFIYTSFQEKATAIAHGNTARQALQFGDTNLAKICGAIAADEKRHEAAYAKIISKLFEVDPDTTMLAFATMMRKKITMPGCFMYDGQDTTLFRHYSVVAQQTGVYTADDYVNILEFFVQRWDVEKVAAGLSSEGRKAQDYVCSLSPKLRRLAERSRDKESRNRASLQPLAAFSWIFNKEV